MQDWEKLWSAGTYNVRYPNENVIRFVMRYCRGTALKVLDVGCGCGNNFMPVVDLECIPVGVDISQYALDLAAEHYPSSELHRYEFGNKLPFVKIEEIRKTLQEVNRVLKDTGYFYISIFLY